MNDYFGTRDSDEHIVAQLKSKKNSMTFGFWEKYSPRAVKMFKLAGKENCFFMNSNQLWRRPRVWSDFQVNSKYVIKPEWELLKKEEKPIEPNDVKKVKCEDSVGAGICVQCGGVFHNSVLQKDNLNDTWCERCWKSREGTLWLYDKYQENIKDKSNRKENKMKWLPKILRRVILLWVFYGAWKLAVFACPWIIRLSHFLPDGMWLDTNGKTCEDGWRIFGMTLIIILGSFIIGLSIFGIHKFAAWLFNESK